MLYIQRDSPTMHPLFILVLKHILRQHFLILAIFGTTERVSRADANFYENPSSYLK